jgi:hypothetical protein
MVTQQAPTRGNEKDKEISIVIRTPAGIPHTFEVRSHDRVDKTTRTAVTYFVGQGQLAEGPYGLALVRDGQATEMVDSGRLEDYGVNENDVLHLIAKGPQVDG